MYIPDFSKYSSEDLQRILNNSESSTDVKIINALKEELKIRNIKSEQAKENIIPPKIELAEIDNKSNSVQNKKAFLASRWFRLGAIILDALIVGTLFTIFYSIIFSYQELKDLQNSENGYYLLFLECQLLYLMLNGYLLYSKGQTIGKYLSNIKIVTAEEKVPSFFDIYIIRYLFPTIIYVIPIIGTVFFFIDVLPIFSKERKCLHDKFAKSKIVNV